MRRLIRVVAAGLLAVGLAGPAARPAQAAVITVTTTNDAIDAAANCGSVDIADLLADDDVSLREALCAANNNAGADTIEFAIAGGGVKTIQPGSTGLGPLPPLTDNATTIDGYTQAGAAVAVGTTPATLMIQLDGQLAGADGNGLVIASANNRVRGLAIYNFGYTAGGGGTGSGIVIGLSTAVSNTLEGNTIGLDAGGVTARPNARDGVFIGLGAQYNLIGGDQAAERNVIAGNGWAGVSIHGSATAFNVVSGNYLGPSKTGLEGPGNTLDGVYIYGGAHDNTVGGDAAAGRRNVISANDRNGVRLWGTGTTGNTVQGNYIGTDRTGAADLGNALEGVYVGSGAQANRVGGNSSVTRNVISGNDDMGVIITGTATTSNTVSGNYIGLDATGLDALPNAEMGVLVTAGAQYNLIGGSGELERNVISANDDGVKIAGTGTASNTVSGNYIGLDRTGLAALGNVGAGVFLDDCAKHNIIGGATPGQRNVLSGNGTYGVRLRESCTEKNVIIGNYIGTNAPATGAVPNATAGVAIGEDVDYTRVGGTSPGEGNVISGNPIGINIRGYASTVAGNFIGTNASGTTALPNTNAGVRLYLEAQSNNIGGSTPGAGNLISGNGQIGVEITGDEAYANHVVGNYIGTNLAGTAAIPNGLFGVRLWDGTYENTLERNVISGNGSIGVVLEGSGTATNTVSGNYIGVDASGLAPLPNMFHGVVLADGAFNNTIGGDLPAQRNIISGHGNYGVGLWGTGTTYNQLIGNYIGTDTNGQSAAADLGNGGMGVVLEAGAQNNVIQRGIIANSGLYGVFINGVSATGNVVNAVSIHDNGVGIELGAGAQGGLGAPSITAATLAGGTLMVQGQACANCVVEVFASPTGDGEGELFLGTALADGAGSYSLGLAYTPWPFLTATQRHPFDGTSEFSGVYTATVQYMFLPAVVR